MKKMLAVLVLVALNAALAYSSTSREVAYAYPVLRFPFYAYQDAGSRLNNFVLSGWTGDYRFLKIDTASLEDITADNTCIRVRYAPVMNARPGYGKQAPDIATRDGYAGFAIQSNPENRWGSLRGGYDLSKAKKVFFFARGKNGGEKIEVGMRKRNENDMTASAGIIELTREWKVYEVSLDGLTFNDCAGGLYILLHGKDRIHSSEIYLDEIYFTQDREPSLTIRSGKSGEGKDKI